MALDPLPGGSSGRVGPAVSWRMRRHSNDCARAGQHAPALHFVCARGVSAAWPASCQRAAAASSACKIPSQAIQRRCVAPLHGCTPSRIRRGTAAAPHSHSTTIRQDKSREVRPGRMAAERGNASALARCNFSPQPPFSDNARKINVRRTSREVASKHPTNGQDKNAAVGRSYEVSRIEVICRHVARSCWRFRPKRQSFQQAQRRRPSPCDGLESGSVAPRILRPFCPAPVSWHTVAMARLHKSRRFADLLRGSAGRLVGPGREK
jgi:hypothetical protein